MRFCSIDGGIFFSFENCGDDEKMMIEETIARHIMDICRVKDMSIAVPADFDDIREALWRGMAYAAEERNEKVCNDIVRSIEYINGLEMKSDESV